MKRTRDILAITSGAVILASSILTFASNQSQKSPNDTTKSKVAVTARTSSENSKLKPQTTCPVQGGDVDKKLFVDYKGKRIYVCCEGCIAEVKKDPETYMQKLTSMGQNVEILKTTEPKKMNKVSAPKADLKTQSTTGSGHDSQIHDGHTH